MKYQQYRYKFYLNASHAIYIDNVKGQNHPHTWEITLNTIKVIDGFVQFDNVERKIDDFLNKFQDKNINEIPPFTSSNPTLENICEYFKDSIRQILAESGWLLLRIEMSETPARAYIIDLVDDSEENVKAIESAYRKKLDDVYHSSKNVDEVAKDMLANLTTPKE